MLPKTLNTLLTARPILFAGNITNYIHKMYDVSIYSGVNVATLSGPICSQLNVFPPKSQNLLVTCSSQASTPD
jgi:hypothetical protein